MNVPVLAIALCCALHTYGEEIRLVNLDPPEAQQYIDKQDTSLKYAPKIESNVPAVRYLGNEPHNVQEDIYLANQYHGQDGLGGYLYGYSVPDIAKTEKKKAGGDLRGAYNYIAGNGQEIKVEYWDDGTGFHQIDNVPKVLPQQIEDTPEVKAAKEEHQRIWNEQAERNSRPIENPYDSHANYPQGSQSQAQHLVNQYQQQKQQFPNPGQNVHYQGDQSPQYQSQSSQNVNKYQPGGQIGGGGYSSSQSSSSNAGQYGGQSGSGQLGGQHGGGILGGAQLGGQPGGGQFGSQHGGGFPGGSQLGGQSGGGQFGSQQGGGFSGGSQLGGQAGGGQFGSQHGGGFSGGSQLGGQPGGGQSGGQFGGQHGAGTLGGAQLGGQLGGAQHGGISGTKLGTQYGLGPVASSGHSSSSAGQYGGGQFGGSQSLGGSTSGSGQFGSGGYKKPSGAGYPSGGPSTSGQYGQSSGQFGSGSSSAGHQGGGILGGAQLGGKPGSSGQYGGSQFSSGGGSHSSGGYLGGSQSGGGHGGYSAGSQYAGSETSKQYASGQDDGQYSEGQDEGRYNEKEEEQGPPKGFFYNFDYPVGIIVSKDGGSIQKREGDLKDIYATNKANFEKQLQQGYSGRSTRSSSGYLFV